MHQRWLVNEEDRLLHNRFKINKEILLYLICLMFLCEPVGVSFSYFSFVFKIGKVLVYIYCLYLLLYRNLYYKTSGAFRILLIYECSLLLSTVINQASIYHWLYYGMTFVCTMFLTEKIMKQYGYRALKGIVFLFCAFLLINLVTYYAQMGYEFKGTTFYFLGLRTRVTDSVAVLALASVMYYSFKKQRFWLYFAVIPSIVVSSVTFNVSTLHVGMLVFVAFALCYKLVSIRRILASKTAILLVGVLIFGVLIFGVQRYFADFFSMLGKGSDLSYRQYIWLNAMPLIYDTLFHTIMGHGVTELGEWVEFEGRMWQSHDQYLQIVLDGGLVSLVLFLAILVKSVGYSLKNRNVKLHYLVISLFISYILMMITEIYSYYPQMYVILALLSSVNMNIGERLNHKDFEKNDINNNSCL